MSLQTMILSPFWLSTTALIKVTFLRRHYTDITLCQRTKTGVTVALIKAFTGFTATVYAVNFFKPLQLYLFAYSFV
jgi:hypothetical protein